MTIKFGNIGGMVTLTREALGWWQEKSGWNGFRGNGGGMMEESKYRPLFEGVLH